jgi:cellulose synthase/poly-beta-1,6-N-acetylglucosamine synthase-like glycosyltransferase
MTTPVLEVIIVVCMAAVVYHYAGYPLVLFLAAELAQAKSDLLYLFGRKSRRCAFRLGYLPRVALLVSAYNEAALIRAKASNTLQLDYPPDRLECLFGLDAPSDDTPELLAQIQSSRLSVHHFDRRRGKLAVLCDLVRRTSAEILVLTDANTMLDRNCVRNLVRHFVDPRVGAVSGEEIRVVAAGTDPGAESLYWRYESALKLLESRLNCSLGGNGAALAVRRSLFRPQKQSIVEDFQIPMEIRFRGHRVVYDPEAVAVEEIAPTFSSQFARRVRISAGNYQTLFHHPEYLNPFQGFLSFSFLSHRLLRWLVPMFLVAAFLCSIPLATRFDLAIPLALQCLFYGMAGLGYWRRKNNKPAGLMAAPLYFCSMNLALVLGLVRYLSGRQSLAWSATPRIAPEVLWNHTRGDR